MQRDMEVVRKVLRAIQSRKDLAPKVLQVDGLDDFTVGYHVALLHAAGYVEGPSISPNSVPYTLVMVKDLTWAGHEFASAILADDSTWEKIRSTLGPDKLVSLPLKVIQEIATKALLAWASTKLGLN